MTWPVAARRPQGTNTVRAHRPGDAGAAGHEVCWEVKVRSTPEVPQGPGAAGSHARGGARLTRATAGAAAAVALMAGCAGPHASSVPPPDVSRIFSTTVSQAQALA